MFMFQFLSNCGFGLGEIKLIDGQFKRFDISWVLDRLLNGQLGVVSWFW